MKIFLCGYMASGKSTVGAVLAEKMQFPFYDLDDEMEKREGKEVSGIFRSKGEIFFRRREAGLLDNLLKLKNDLVLSLGGGTPCYGKNLELIKQTEDVKLVYLKLSAEEITERLFQHKNNRPLIAHLKTREELLEFVRKHLFERNFYYNQSDIIVDAEGKSPETVANLISENIKRA